MNFIYNDALNKYLNRAQAIARITGSKDYPNIKGIALFYQTRDGVIIETKVEGLKQNIDKCGNNFHAMHIHSGSDCKKGTDMPFINAGTHYNPDNCNHPGHRGDLLPLVANNVVSYSKVLYNKFTINEIIGKVLIIHETFDDFKTQPAGNAGKMIACGEIKNY